MQTNYFASAETAARYARARPELNTEFNSRLVQNTGHLGRVLDVGCGTGISTRALTRVAGEVHGVDPSRAMLSEALPESQISYCVGVAEHLPYAANSFDLLGVGLAIHWFDQRAFLSEAARVLRPEGWLFITNTWFAGTMRDVPGFAAWTRDRYLERYPIPRRNRVPITDTRLARSGFGVSDRWDITREVPMSLDLCATYLTTQSNVSARRERMGESLGVATDWLTGELKPFFEAGQRLVRFGGSAILLQHSPAEQRLAAHRRSGV